MADIASHAGLSKGSIYLYFKDKNAVLKALIETLAGPQVDVASALFSATAGPVAPQITAFLLALGTRIETTRVSELVKILISEARAHPEIGQFFLQHILTRALPLLQSAIARGVESGEFRPVDPALVAKCVMGPMILSAVWKTVLHPLGAEALDARALARQHADLIVNGLAAS